MTDIYRMKKMFFQLRFYYRDTGETASIASMKDIYKKPIKTTEKYPPFEPEDRIEYFKKLHDELFKMQISSVISRYGHRFGVSQPPGENTGSVDYELTLYKPDEDLYKEELIPIEIPVEIPVEIPDILKTWPYAGIPTAYSPTLDKFINKSVYNDIKMCARPEWHIYGITKVECHQRLKEHGIDAKNTDILTKEFKMSDLVNISQRTRDKIDLLQQRINKTENVKVKKILTDEISAILIGLGISKEDVMNIIKIE